MRGSERARNLHVGRPLLFILLALSDPPPYSSIRSPLTPSYYYPTECLFSLSSSKNSPFLCKYSLPRIVILPQMGSRSMKILFQISFFYSLHFKRMSFLPPKSGVVWLFFPKPSVNNSHTPPSACGLVWSMGILHLWFGKE